MIEDKYDPNMVLAQFWGGPQDGEVFQILSSIKWVGSYFRTDRMIGGGLYVMYKWYQPT